MMKALIIEDETAAARNLTAILRQTAPEVEIVATLESVAESIEWLRANPQPDLFFMDIHLADGDSFRIFDAVEITAPVIFTTAYDRYALDAFKVNSIDYLLKPLDDKALNALLDRLASNKKLSVDDEDEEPVVQDQDSESPSLLIERARLFIKENYTRPLALNDVAQALDVSPSYLSSVFKSDKGETYTKYILRLRMERAAKLLVSYKAGKVGDIAQEAGFTSTKYFDSAFKKYFGMTPNEYRQSESGS